MSRIQPVLSFAFASLLSTTLGAPLSATPRQLSGCGVDGPILTRTDLNNRLGTHQIFEGFESFSISVGSAVNLDVICLDDTGIANMQGPNLVQPGAQYCDPSNVQLQWNGDQYYGRTTQTLLSNGTTGTIDIHYTTAVTACGFDVSGYLGFGYTGTATFSDLNNIAVGTVNFQIITGGSERFFVGFAHAAGIGQVSIASSTYSWSPKIDDHGYGDCAANATYCTAGTTSNGCLPSIAWSGSASATAVSGFTISVSALEGQKQGILFYGINNSGFTPSTWGTSTSYLCVKHPTQRMGVLFSGGTFNVCDGALSVDWNAYRSAHPGALGNPFAAGQHVFAQCWFRDPPSPKTTMLSNALEFAVGP